MNNQGTQASSSASLRILFLHGWQSVVGGVKPTYLKDAGHTVINPALDDDDFNLAVRAAQAEYDEHQPDVIVGSSRGGAVAMNISNEREISVGYLLCKAPKGPVPGKRYPTLFSRPILSSGVTPLVLLCPAWKNWGTATSIKPNSVILHSRQDDVIPFADSEELIANSGLPSETLIEVGDDHRLADPEPLRAMLVACLDLAWSGREQ